MYGNSILVDSSLSNNIWSSSKLENAVNFLKLNKNYTRYNVGLYNNYYNNSGQGNVNNYESSIF
jgi:hypothetical protein